MAVVQPVSFLHNRTDHTAQTDRLAATALLSTNGTALSWRQGACSLFDLRVTAQDTPNMTVAVAGGQAFIRQTSAGQGCYVLTNDASVDLNIAAAHATLSRHDLIVARVTDEFFSGSDNEGSLEVITGTAASTPADPAVSGNYITLARITVTPAATAITNAMITDVRPIATANGGVVPVNTTAERDALTPYRGLVVDNAQTGNLERHNGTTWQSIPTGSLTSWVDYTPTLTGIGGTINYAKWHQVGKLVSVDFKITVTSDLNSDITVTLPVAPQAGTASDSIAGIGSVVAYRADISRRRGGTAYLANTTAMGFLDDSLAGSDGDSGKWNTSTNTPWTWISGSTFGGMVHYRVA